MKWLVLLITAVTAALLASRFALPDADSAPAIRWGSPEPILPMTFAHGDHQEQNCLDCHHNYYDDTGMEPCMNCHVTNDDVWPLLEEQFHDFCRNCHVEEQLAGKDSGPTRVCIDCHFEEQRP